MTPFDLDTAILLAQVSAATYDGPGAALPAGVDVAQWALPGPASVVDDYGCVARWGEARILAFRGTHSIADWLTDLCIDQVRVPGIDGMVHRGFHDRFFAFWDRAGDVTIDPAAPLFLTGHSLGGAVATIAARLLAPVRTGPTVLYTFGSPRVGDPDFVSGFHTDHWRVTNHADIVPHCPGNVDLAVSGLVRYQHCGSNAHIGRDGSIKLGVGIGEALEDFVFGARHAIDDHGIGVYLARLEAARAAVTA
jgi:triacylglycerol lipase